MEGLGKGINESCSSLNGFSKYSVILVVKFANLTVLWNIVSYLSEDKLILWWGKSNYSSIFTYK